MFHEITSENFNDDCEYKLAQLRAKQAEEKRLLALYIQHIQKTGESNYPVLVSLIQDCFEVEQSSQGLLTQAQIQQLSKRLDEDINCIESAINNIYWNLEELKVCLENKKNISSREQGISEQLQEYLSQLNDGSKDIIQLFNKYINVDIYSKKDQSEEAKKAQIWKECCEDIRYFCEFLNKHLQVEMIKQDYAYSQKEPIYFKRIYDYQELLLETARSLKLEISYTLEGKQTGGNFASKSSL